MKENIFTFYVNKFALIKEVKKEELSSIPMLIRRRMNDFDKFGYIAMKNAYEENIQNIIFSSLDGQAERLNELIFQYGRENSVSPALFSGSVHNYTPGLFLFIEKKSIPYNSISSFSNALSFGLLSSVISSYDEVLYCFTDKIDGSYVSFALNISKNGGGKKYILELNSNETKEDNIEEFQAFFGGKINVLYTKMYKACKL